MELSKVNWVWRLAKLGLCFLGVLLLVGVSAIPVVAQEGASSQKPRQRPGQSTTTTRDETLGPDGTKTSRETVSTQSRGSKYSYSGIPGKFTRSGGSTLGQGQLAPDQERRGYYRFELSAQGLPKDSNPTEAYYFERDDGKLIMVDPLVTQRYSNYPR